MGVCARKLIRTISKTNMKCYLHNFIIEYFLFFTIIIIIIIIIIALALRKTTVPIHLPFCRSASLTINLFLLHSGPGVTHQVTSATNLVPRVSHLLGTRLVCHVHF